MNLTDNRQINRRKDKVDLGLGSLHMGFPRPHSGKESACQFRGARDIQSLGQEDPLEEEMATHSSILA